MEYKCQMCNVGFPKFPLDIFFSHIKLNHSLDGKRFYAICHVDGCSRVFQCFASFKRHWYKCGFINTSEPQEINVISFQADSSVENSGKPIFIALQFHAISKITLVIQVYFDEVEPSNPLGTKTGTKTGTKQAPKRSIKSSYKFWSYRTSKNIIFNTIWNCRSNKSFWESALFWFN